MASGVVNQTNAILISEWDILHLIGASDIEKDALNFLKSKRLRAERSFPCPNCSSVYNRHDNLTQHLKYVCLQKPRFACPYCNYISKRTYNVYGHIRSLHPNSKVGYLDLQDSNNFVTPPSARYSYTEKN